MINSAKAGLALGTEEFAAPQVYEFNPLADGRWETFVRKHPRASVFHSTSWLRSLRNAYGYEPAVLTTTPALAALSNGLPFCRVRSWLTGQRLVSLPFSDHCEPLVERCGELDALLQNLKEQVEGGQLKYAEIRPALCQPGEATGFGNTVAYYIHRLNLAPSPERLFQRFHKSCVQRKIRRAEREGLSYEEGTSEPLLRQFYRLLVVTRRRLFLPPQPMSWFRALIASFGPDLKIRVVSKDEVPVASILTLAHKRTMVYKYGCSDARLNRFGGMPLLLWIAIQEAKQKGCDEFDMGRSDGGNPGLISFKDHWGTVSAPLHYWRYPSQIAESEHTWQKQLLRRIVPLTPSLALRITGRFFYGHIG
jgi:CelD/BcsL family acetyltransferase involved in cellulose biosynthesis